MIEKNVIGINNSHSRKTVSNWIIPFLAVFDPLVNQYAKIQGYGEEGSPLLQIFRLIILAFIFLRLCLKINTLPKSRSFFVVSILFLSLLGSISVNGIDADEARNYGHLIYWALLWLLVEDICRSQKWRNRLENGLTIGSGLIIFSVLFGYFTGTGLNYNGVTGLSAGWFNSAKTAPITASLGFFILANRYERKNPNLMALFFILTMLCVWLMQGRAAILAFLTSVTWVAYRRLKLPRVQNSWQLKVLFFLLIIVTVLFYSAEIDLISFSNAHLLSLDRWKELGSESGGSGRKIFWVIDLEKYFDLDIVGKLFGIGLSGIKEVNYDKYGMAIHTHNDILDALLVGGLFMLGAFFSFWRFLIKKSLSKRIDYSSQTYSMAFVIMLIINGTLTGFIFSSSDMFAILSAWSCVTLEGEMGIIKPTRSDIK